MLDTSPCLHIDSTPFGSPPIRSSGEKQGIQLELERRACQSLREVLQLKLQQRRTREELVSQGIMPPLKSPPAFHEQRRSLERARTEDYLKRKIRSRPARSELVRMHILEETCVEASLQAKQLMLKKARLADDLNDKLSQRPGPMELIEKNIIPVDSSIKQAIIETENSSCDEDSSDALSPDQLVNQDSTDQSSPHGSAPPSASPDAPDNDTSRAQAPPPPPPPPLPVPTAPASQQKLANGTAAQKPTSGQIKGSKAVADRTKKQKDSKPKVRKLKYHQYIPPDQKTEREALPPLDSAYSRLLHQQQLFLQLQIISQQQHSNYQTILPAPPRPPGDQQGSSTSGSSSTKKAPPPQPPSTNTNGLNHHAFITINLPPLPPNLDELKVAELKQELKIRGLTVSGTKNDLIERLKTFHELNGGSDPPSNAGGANLPATSNTSTSQPPQQQPIVQSSASTTIFHQSRNTGMVVAALPLVATVGRGGAPSAIQTQMMQFGSCSPSPPLSPTHSEHSLAGMSPDDHICNGDAFGEMVSSPLTQLSLQPSTPTPPTVHIMDESPPALPPAARASSHPFLAAAPSVDKDWMLQEKDRRIAELTRMLQQKQQLVDRLRSQLQDQHTGGGAFMAHPPITVKEEPQDIPMEVVEEMQAEQPRHQQEQRKGLEEVILQQNQLNLHKQTQHRRKKTHKQQPSQTLGKQQQQPQQQQQVSHAFINQQSGALPSFPMHSLNSNSSQTLVKDNNGNHFLLKLTNHNTENQGNNCPQNKVTNRVTPQRQKSTPTKLPSQSAPQMLNSDILSKQQTICKQPLKKALKPEKHGSTNHTKVRSSSFCTPSKVQPFFATESVNNPVHSSSNHMDEMCVHVDQHVLFTPPSPKVNTTPTSRRKKSGRTQRIDDLFDILVQSGEISANFKPTPDPALSRICASSPPLSPSLSPLHLSPPTPSIPETPLRASSEEPPAQEEFNSCSTINGRLEDFLESTTGKPLLGVEPGGHVTLIDELHSQLLSTPSILDHPSSPMDTYEFGLSSSRTGLELAESALDSMDWLDLGIGGSIGDGPCTASLNGHAPTSVFSTDFLDSSDLHLHWDC